MTETYEAAPSYVGFWMRVLAAIIDFIVLFVLNIGISMAVGMDTILSIDIQDPSQVAALQQQIPIIPTLVTTLYVLGFWLWKQATPGKMVIGAKIAAADSFGAPSASHLVRRFILFILPNLAAFIATGLSSIFGIVFLISCIWVAIDERKQGLHDKIGGTVVIKK